MIRPIIKDEAILGKRSAFATEEDSVIADDLLDTLKANVDRCVGLAANMIGVNRKVIVFIDDGTYQEMFNPEIVKAEGAYQAEEGCLSFEGTRKVKRYRSVKVRWQTRDFKTKFKVFTGMTAQVIQHEIDHCNGVIV